jgi:preprotein translocase subunit SecF
MLETILSNKIYLSIILVIFIISLYYFVDYKTRSVVKNELIEIKKYQLKKQRMYELQMKMQTKQKKQEIQDIDSYVDPVEKFEQREQDQDQEQEQNQDQNQDQDQDYEEKTNKNRLSRHDIMQRDIIDR